MLLCWIAELTQKRSRRVLASLSQLLQTVFSRKCGSASPVSQEVSRQGGWMGSWWIWVSCCLTSSLPCFLFSSFECPVLLSSISKVSLPWSLWSLLASEPQTILLEGTLLNYLTCLCRDLTSVCFSLCSNNSMECTNFRVVKWEAILVSIFGGWK